MLAELGVEVLVVTEKADPEYARLLPVIGAELHVGPLDAVPDVLVAAVDLYRDPVTVTAFPFSARIQVEWRLTGDALEVTTALFAEDMARNLVPAKAAGMTTVWVDNGSEQGPGTARDHIDYITHDIVAWLRFVEES